MAHSTPNSAQSGVARKLRSAPKVKTGCGTCRIRKVKCDEKKPSCHKCISTGRACDGYQSPFRTSVKPVIRKSQVAGVGPITPSQHRQVASAEVRLEDVELLNRYFSIKTIFDIKLDCDQEAKQILQASLTDPSVRHAVLSLRALREDFETGRNDPSSHSNRPGYRYGLQQYNVALAGLASKLSAMGPDGLKSALLCCQIFISIEQIRMNYAVMAQHIIQGLKIMHEYRARPFLSFEDKLFPAHHNQLPFLDVFVIKMFSAPCEFAEPKAKPSGERSKAPGDSNPPLSQSPQISDERNIAPNMRTELRRIGQSTIELLHEVSTVESLDIAHRLLSRRATLLNSLELWLIDFESFQNENDCPEFEPVSSSFLRLFYSILRIIVLGILDSAPDLESQLHDERDQMQNLANDVSERLRFS